MPTLKSDKAEAYARRRARAFSFPESLVQSLLATRPGLNYDVAQRWVNRFNKEPEVQDRIAELAAQVESRVETQLARQLPDMQIAEAMAELIQVWKTPVADVDEHHHLAQEVTYDSYTTGSGKGQQTHTKKKVKMVGKFESMALLFKAKGWTQEAAVSISFPGFAATVRDVTPQGLLLAQEHAQDAPDIESGIVVQP